MHKVISSYLARFVKDNALDDLDQAKQFERLVNYLVISSFYPDNFDLEDVTTGPDDFSIDGAAVLLGDELAASKEDAKSILGRTRPRQQLPVNYVFVQAKRSEKFDAGDLLKFGSGVANLFDDEKKRPNDALLKEILATHELVVKNLARVNHGRPTCRLYFATTGVWNEDSGLSQHIETIKKLVQETGLFHRVAVEPLDRERLVTLWNQAQAPVEATLPVKSFMPLPSIAGVEEAYLAVTAATDFVDRLLADDEGRMRAQVFEQNVRAYLGDENPVNSKIRLALESPDTHDRFALLNNGLTIVSPDVRVQSDRLFVADYQIVNGCQTSHVLFRNREKLSDKIFIPLKVIEADDPEIVGQVVEATNSQSDVGETQFISIRPFVRKLQNYFDAFETEEERDRRLYFERRTRQYAGHDIGKMRIFDIQKLARAFAAMFLDVPHLAARYPTQTFQEKSEELFQNDQREHAYYSAALALYRLELSLGNQYVPRAYQRYKWHLLMVVRYQLAGREMPTLNSRRLDSYCDKIVKAFTAGGKASAAPFQRAVEVIDRVGEANRDRLKRQAYTDLLKLDLGVIKK